MHLTSMGANVAALLRSSEKLCICVFISHAIILIMQRIASRLEWLFFLPSGAHASLLLFLSSFILQFNLPSAGGVLCFDTGEGNPIFLLGLMTIN